MAIERQRHEKHGQRDDIYEDEADELNNIRRASTAGTTTLPLVAHIIHLRQRIFFPV